MLTCAVVDLCSDAAPLHRADPPLAMSLAAMPSPDAPRFDENRHLQTKTETPETEKPKTEESKTSCGTTGDPSAVHLRFAQAAGRRLKRSEPTTCPGEEPFWTERPLLIKRADGTYELIGTSRNLGGLARWVLSFGTSAEVFAPSPLQRRVTLLARRVWKQYDD